MNRLALTFGVSVVALSTVAAAPDAPLKTGEGLRAIETRPFTVRENVEGRRRWQEATAALERRCRRAPLAAVVSDLNRKGRRLRMVSGVAPTGLHRAFGWNLGDELTFKWYPQGVAGGRVGERHLFVVSWYHKKSKGARVSFVDANDLGNVRYRHVLLVEPVIREGRVDFEPIHIHAGGVAWVDRKLWVPDTSRGFRVFDLDHLLEVGDEKDGDLDAFGYKYVLPQTTEFVLAPGSEGLAFSTVSLDGSTWPRSLVTGEYRKEGNRGRVFRWELDEARGGLRERDGVARPSQAFLSSHTRIQGVLATQGKWFLSCSSQRWIFGELHATGPGRASRSRGWALGPESLYLENGNLWSLSEFPGERAVFCVKLAEYD